MARYLGRDNNYGMFTKQILPVDGEERSFSLSYKAPTAASLLVVNNGAVLMPDVEGGYTLDKGGMSIVFDTAPVGVVYILYLGRELSVPVAESNITFSTATTGNDFNITSVGSDHTFSIPNASTSARGLITAGTQTIGGNKTLVGSLVAQAQTASTKPFVIKGAAAQTANLLELQTNSGSVLFAVDKTGNLAIGNIPTSNISGLAAVATSGSYNDLSNQPYIPSGLDTLMYLRDNMVLDDIINLSVGSPTDGDVLRYYADAGPSGEWQPCTLPLVATSGSYTDLLDKPTGLATEDYVDTKVANLVNGAPELLDTLKELSDALGADENFASTVANNIGTVAANLSIEIGERSSADLTFVKLDGSRAMDANLNLNNNKIVGLSNPTSDSDAATKRYVDLAVSGLNNVGTLNDLSDVTITSVIKGQFIVYNGTQFVNSRTIEANAASTIPLTVKGVAGQSASLFQAQNSSGNSQFSIDSWGNVAANNAVRVGIGADGMLPSAGYYSEIGRYEIISGLTTNQMNGSHQKKSVMNPQGFETAAYDENNIITQKLGVDSTLGFYWVDSYDAAILPSSDSQLTTKAYVDLAVGSIPAERITGALPIANGGTGATTAQTAINNLTQVSSATNGYVLTKDSVTGNAAWKPIVSASYDLADGGVATPALKFASDPNTGIYRIGEDRIGFTANGQPALTVDGTSGVGYLAVGDVINLANSRAVSRFQIIDDNNNAQSGITLGINPTTSVKLYKSASNSLTILGTVANTVTASKNTLSFQSGDSNSKGIWLSPDLGTGGFNPISVDGDQGIIFSKGSMGTGALVIAPHSNTQAGIRIDSSTTAFYGNGAKRFGIDSAGTKEFINGYVTFHNTAITNGAGTNALRYSTITGLVTWDSSSELIKENIVDCPYGLSTVMQLQPRKYFRIDDQKHEIGFIAGEVSDIIPELVSHAEKSRFTKNPEDTDMVPSSVAYEKLTAALCKAIQELNAKVETLEARLQELEQK